MNKKILIGSILAVVLLVLVSFSSVVGYSSVKSNPDNTIITDELDFEYCKDYLFETIIEIANNQEFQNVFKDNKQNLFSFDYESEGVFSQLLKQKPLSPLRMVFNKPSLSVDYLGFMYNQGCDLVDILGEEQVSQLVASIEISNQGIFEELHNIMMNDKELSNRIETLSEMNCESISRTSFAENPIICIILGILSGSFLLVFGFFWSIMGIFEQNENVILLILTLFISYPFFITGLVFWVLFIELGCFPSPYFP